MLQNFGVALKKYLFSPIDEILFDRIKKDITTSIRAYAKDVVIRKLSILRDESMDNGGNILHVILVLAYKSSNELFEVKVGIV